MIWWRSPYFIYENCFKFLKPKRETSRKDAANIVHRHSKSVTRLATTPAGAATFCSKRSHHVFFPGAILDGMFV